MAAAVLERCGSFERWTVPSNVYRPWRQIGTFIKVNRVKRVGEGEYIIFIMAHLACRGN